MISIHTNLSSLITQQNMTQSTNKLNQAIERMSTGYKINHAGDNAANYSISNNMNVQLSSYDIAADNIAMGMDLLSTAQDTIAGMQDRGNRLHSLIIQARNGTYGESSLAAINSEAQALVSEINRLYINTEYNGRKLLEIPLPEWAQTVKANAGKLDGKSLEQCAIENNGFIAEVVCDTPQVIVTDPSQLATEIASSKTIIGIGNAETLAELANLVNGTSTYVTGVKDCSGKTIVLTEDVDLTAICAANTDSEGNGGWIPIGYSSIERIQGFQGTFNGNGHKVTGLYIKREKKDYQGLFGHATGEIKNIGVEGVNVTGLDETGGLAGHAGGAITNSYATGNVTGNNLTGGLAGKAGRIHFCYATGNVTGINETGGLAGNVAAITNSYATGNVTGNRNRTGGLAGAAGTITNSYATGNVTGVRYTGGMAGEAHGAITDSFATGNVTVGTATDNSQTYYNGVGEAHTFTVQDMTFQVGINGGSDSQISVDTSLSLNLSISDLTSDSAFNNITNFLKQLSNKATELGAAQNRLESALESTLVNMDNLTSSLSTIRDADIGKVSSDYIRQQILQQACATLMSTANQSPSIALQLI